LFYKGSMLWLLLSIPLGHSTSRLPLHDNIGSNSPGYKIASEILTKSINFSVDPCVDFFEFACGNWKAEHPIPSHKTSYSQFVVLFDKSYGEWPMLEGNKWRVDQFDLTTLFINIAAVRGVDIFITNYVTLDNKNVSRRLIEFDQGELGLGASTRDYYLDRKKHGKKITAYREYLISKVSAQIFYVNEGFSLKEVRMEIHDHNVKLLHEDAGLPINERKIASDVDEIIQLETELAKILVAEENRRNYTKMYNLRHLSDMQTLMPLVRIPITRKTQVDWARYFHSVAPFSLNKYLASDPQVLITEIDFLKRVTRLINSTDPRIITNYAYLSYASSWSGELGERYEDIAQKKKAPRWKDCTTTTMHRLKYATGALYIKKSFNEASKNVTLEMVNDLQDAFHNMVVGSDWMDETTKAVSAKSFENKGYRNKALDKAGHMLRQIGYPDFILDEEKLDDYYSGLLIEESDSYSQMVEKLIRWGIEFHFKRLMKPVDRTEYNFNPAVVNAFYSSTSNSISKDAQILMFFCEFPAAILQAPFFHQTFPKALNYGGIGAVIGHEITHGFDDEGRQFDAVGNLRDWWDDEVQNKFKKRAQCIIDQYDKIEVPGTDLHVKGKLTQGENIADNGGVKQALKAYKNYLKKFGEEQRIKGLEKYNNEQMFFIGYATIWCGHSTADSLINLILTDPHAPQQYRVNQVLANQPEFATAFNCAVGTPMNPTRRCAVW
uniref:Neprilysin n=1 Tax=Angiostrongylus cantonensis TaxID=6313 RepID=A0A158P6V6_ANGCA